MISSLSGLFSIKETNFRTIKVYFEKKKNIIDKFLQGVISFYDRFYTFKHKYVLKS